MHQLGIGLMPEGPSSTPGSFLTQILDPGSSLHPTFLLILDGVLGALFLLLLLLLIVSENVHFLALLGIELGLWASIKWFLRELKRSGIEFGTFQTNTAALEEDPKTN